MSEAIEPEPENRTARRRLAALMIGLGAAIEGFGASYALTVVIEGTVLPLYVDGGVLWSLALLFAAMVTVGSVVLALRVPTRGVRIAAVALGLFELGVALYASVAYDATPGWPVAVAAFGGAIALGYAVRAPRPDAPPRALAFGIALAVLLAWGQAAVSQIWLEYQPQTLPPHRLELVAAYSYSLEIPPENQHPNAMPSVVVDANGDVGEVITLDEQRWNLHRTDALQIAPADLRRVRFFDEDGTAGISLRVAGETRVRLNARARQRGSQFDVFMVDDEPRGLVFHAIAGPGYLFLFNEDRDALRALFVELTTP